VTGRFLVLLLCVTVTSAHADQDAAKARAAEGEALAARGDFAGAATRWRAAYREEPRPEYICNVGVAYHKLADLPRAHRYLGQCVTMGASLDPAYRANLRKVMESIDAKLVAGDFTPVDLVVEPGNATVTIEGGLPYDEAIVGSARLWFPYGTYELRAQAPGYQEKLTEVRADRDAALALRITLDKLPPPDTTPPPDPRREPEVAPRGEAHVILPSKVPAIVATATTGATAIAAAIVYVKARGYVDDAEAALTPGAYDDLHAKAHTFQRTSWVLAGLAGIGAGVSAVLWYRALSAPATIEITPAPGGASVSFGGRF